MPQIRRKKTGEIGTSREFNTYAMSEILVYFDTWMDTDFISEYDVFLEQSTKWKDLSQAMRDKDIITNNHNTRFFEPPSTEDRKRGFTFA